jgi:hypothetical protein
MKDRGQITHFNHMLKWKTRQSTEDSVLLIGETIYTQQNVWGPKSSSDIKRIMFYLVFCLDYFA